MARYFFHLRDGQYISDTEGTELPDIRSAQREAVKFAGGLLRDNADKFWNGEDWRFEVTDGTGLVLFTLHFSAVVSAAMGAHHGSGSNARSPSASP